MIALAARDSGGGEGDEDAAQPDESWLNAVIQDWAEEKGIDLAGARTKAEMLAVIREAEQA